MKPRERLPEYVMECTQLAALLEVSGYPKPGNVHRTADLEDLHYEDFLSSSIALGPPMGRLARRGLGAYGRPLLLSRLRIGGAIREAVEETSTWQKGGNTHLGTILLFAPFAAAAGLLGSLNSINPASLRRAAQKVVDSTTTEDASSAFKAITRSTRQTLGRLSSATAPDLSIETRGKPVPRMTLLEAMRYSSKWDGIASEWSTGFEKTFIAGLPFLLEVFSETRDVNVATVHTFLFLLSHFPDTFIARKVGLKRTLYVEEAVLIGMEETRWVTVLASQALRLGGLTSQAGRDAVFELDNRLRREEGGLNPGTTADLTGACLLAALLCGWRP